MCRVSRAADMISDTDLSISEIAFLCGFWSLSQFNRSFRSVMGKSPGELRRNG